MKKLALFPLDIVLFPDSVYPLHVTEERYKRLVKDALNSNQSIGINLLTSKEMYKIGCEAEIFDVIKTYDNGSLDIAVKGIRRYKVNNFYEENHPYYTADITYIDDVPEEIDTFLYFKISMIYNDIISQLDDVQLTPLGIKCEPNDRYSFKIAQKSGLETEEKQAILEMNSENQRLDYLLNHLSELKPMVENITAIDKIVKYDGYLSYNIKD